MTALTDVILGLLSACAAMQVGVLSGSRFTLIQMAGVILLLLG